MEEIYERYSRLVYNYLYTLTKNVELSEELSQETFYSAIKSINKFKNECNISVWLCQIAKNKW
jgi:RNA polymerase sigma-70 factor (ECF subfamily)